MEGSAVRGLFRFRDPDTGDVDVLVEDAGFTQHHLSEVDYRSNGHAPPFEELPWSSDPYVFVGEITPKE
jgi:hypothetical protein